MKKYHCFYVNPYGSHHRYEVYEELKPMLELVKREREGGGTDVMNLVVIYGEALEFEPKQVVTAWTIKG